MSPATLFDFDLGETVDAIREAVREFAEREIAPLAAEIDRSDHMPRAIWPALGKLDLLGVSVEEEYGGAGLGYVHQLIVVEELSRASSSVGIAYGAHTTLCTNQIRRHGSHEQKHRYLPALISGDHVGSLAMSEAESGSDVVSMRLRADRDGDCYVLNGQKQWITNGADADVIVVYAKTQPNAGSKGISAFIVESRFEGFSTGKKVDKLGMRGSGTCELIFENCRVPAENLLGAENHGVKVLMSGLDIERAVLCAGPIGLMQGCLDVVLPYVRTRKQFGQQIGEFQLIQAKLADMYTALNAARAYAYAVARACDRGTITSRDAAAAILFAAENGTQTALQAIQCLGGNGYTNDYPLARMLRDAKLWEIGAGTSEIRRLIIGRELYREG